MRKFFLNIIASGFFLSMSANSESDKNFSLGIHGFESLIGNYGLTLSYKVARHVSITTPLEFYSFAHSIPGSVANRFLKSYAADNGFNNVQSISMFHLRAGLGARVFLTPSALSDGLYFEPIVYAGWIRSTNFSGMNFNNQHDVLSAFVDAVYRGLPVSDHFAVTPQIKIGYQWVSDGGALFQLAAFGGYVYSPSLDSIFNAGQRFFNSNAVNSSLKSAVPSTAVEMFRAFGTQMAGWHAGLALNIGFAI